jgi:RecA/RadA recombinase
MYIDYLKKLEQDMRSEVAGPQGSKDFLSSGSTLLNMAATGTTRGCFSKGKMILFVGDSNSGKTFMCLGCLAEACRNKNFNNYRLIYDNVEDGAMMNIQKYFGQAVVDRLEAPSYDKQGNAVFSETVEGFYDHLDDACQEDRPFIYILDSMDSLTTTASDDKFREGKAARAKGKETTGSYGDGKAKLNSENLRRFMTPLRKTGSILIVISQTRDNIGFGAMFNPKTRGGGRSLKFYATLEIWSSVKGLIKKKVRGKDRQVGIVSLVHVKKNRVDGKDRQVTVPIMHSVGVDDVASCVDYLVEEKTWKKSDKGIIDATDLDFKGTRDQLIQHIEKEGLEKTLHILVKETWDDIEKACEGFKRKSRYE